MSLQAGAYQYKFVINGTDWRTDPEAAESVEDGNGNRNSLIWVDPFGKEPPARVGDGKITSAALLHRPLDLRDCNGYGGHLYITLRTRGGDVERVNVKSSGVDGETIHSMTLLHSDPVFSYFRAALPNRSCRYA